MNKNTPAILRSLVIFGLCIPLAAWIGYLLAAPAERSTFIIGAILAFVMLTPLLLRWHHFLLITCWNLSLTIFFLPGSPPVWLLLTVLSLGLSVLHRTLNNEAHFLHAPEIARPLVFLLVVVLGTAELTGGIGLNSMGSGVTGGKNYILMIFGILGYFAVTAIQIPPHRVNRYIGLFFLINMSSSIGDFLVYLPSAFKFLYAFFPASAYNIDLKPGSLAFNPRYAGLGVSGMALFMFMNARYGVRGILLSGKPWRWILIGVAIVLVFLGGFRSHVILCSLVFITLFFLEGLHRTQAMPVLVMAGIIAITLLVPFASHLPFTFQRSLAFLPLKLDKAARQDAEGSTDWRLEIWRDTYPRVPQYLLLGKGYAISQSELAIAKNRDFRYLSVADEVAISGNYHSGPLSVLMPFGAWGGIALLWLWFGGARALYNNYRYGDPVFRVVNSFLFACFIVRIFMFLVVFGSIENDVAYFAVLFGLSVSINGGIRRPPPVPVIPRVKSRVSLMAGPPLQPVFPR
jgi:hypothetical protein